MTLRSTFLASLTTAVIALGGAASAQCDGSADIPSNAIADETWATFASGDVDGLIAGLEASGVANPALVSGLQNVFRQRPEGFNQCTVLLRNHISDRIFAEYVVIGDNDAAGFYANIAVIRIGSTDRIIRFSIDSNLNPDLFAH